ncbi:MAG: hypothetical protein JNJ55_08030 [Betaproteobacteria bacterium]|nr:hypothetical protein [Betaproteobacteria bacterium]
MTASRKPTNHWLPLVGLPLISVLMPWPLAFRLLRWFARTSTCFDEFVDPALTNMRKAMGSQALPADEFKWRHRLLRLIDQTDAWLAATRSHRWFRRHVDVEGQWPETPFVALGFHYGAGTFIWKHFAHARATAHFLAQRADLEQPGPGGALPWNLRIRKALIERATGSPIIATGGSFERMRDILSRGEVMVVLVDTPAHGTRQSHEGRLFGKRFTLPTGVFELARRARVPLVPWSMHFDPRSGRRKLTIHPALNPGMDNARLTQESLSVLESLLTQDPAGWHLWPQFALFAGDDSVRAKGSLPDGES